MALSSCNFTALAVYNCRQIWSTISEIPMSHYHKLGQSQTVVEYVHDECFYA